MPAKPKRKPLSERVKWLNFPTEHDWSCIHGGIAVLLKAWHRPGEWEVTAIGWCKIIEATTLAAAKRKALAVVQQRLTEAYEEWRD